MQPVRSDVNLRPLFTKLGHQLEEIRVRSMNNIISKLDHNVICEADVVQEKYFLIRLLEWFNFPSVPMRKEVVNLIEKLSKHSSAAGIFLEIGGVEFMSQLRPTSEPELQIIIDKILENMLTLPDVGEMQHKAECIYHKHLPSKDDVSSRSDAKSSEQKDTRIHHEHITQTQNRPTYDIEEPQVGYFVHQSHQQSINELSANQQLQLQTSQGPGYEMTSCFQFSTFPWLPLTSTDKQVLTSTDSSLRSSNPVLVANSCEFLSQVVLKDFPAEIFLQRPNIVQSLLALLKLKPPHEHTLPLSAVKCLKDLSINLQARITFYHDPALYCPKQVDFGTSGSSNSSSNSNSTLQSSLISVSRPTVLGYSGQRLRGDGQEGDSSLTSTPMQSPRHGNILQESSSDVETDSEDMIALQFGQITVPQFCILVLEHATPLLKTNNADMVVHCTKLLTEILQLLKQAIGQDIWQEKSVVAREVTEKLVDVFEILGDVLLHHHHSKGNISENMVEHDIIQHRLAFIMISMYVTQFIESLLPIDKASDVLPESLNSALCLVVMDYTLCLTYPNIKDIALKYITETNSDQYEIYNSAMSVYDSMQSACKFLKTCDYQCDVSVQVQISMAEEALHSIPYHYHMPLVEKFIHLCSDICKPINVNTSLVTQCTKVFLKYLAHPLGKVKTCSYTVILDIVKDALGITQVTQPGLLTYSNVKFLLDSQILYEISCFGMTDGDEQVSLMARQILLYLLQSKLLMSSAVWKQFIDVLLPVISILQAYVEKQTNLGTSILDIIHCKPEDKDKKGEPLLPKLDHFRCNLRLMFSKSCSVRSETIKHILEFLSKEEDSCNKLPTSTQAALTDMGNLFIMDQPVTIDDSHNSVFQVDGLLKVYNILTSSTVEANVRKSAAEQLAVILQDVTLHQGFLKHDGLEMIIQLLRSSLVKPADSKEQELVIFIPPCLSMLRRLIHQNYSLRHQLAHDITIYFILIRCSLLFSTDDRVRYESAHILTLLLFDEVASLDSKTSSPAFEISLTGFSLPKTVVDRYSLPFKAHSHHIISPYRVVTPLSSDPLRTGPPADMLTMGWNIAWHHGIELLAEFIKDGKSHDEDVFASKLYLSKVDKIIVCCSHTVTGIKQCLDSMLNASSHYMVKTSLMRLVHYIVTENIHNKGCNSHSLYVTNVLYKQDWKAAFGRYLQVIPANTDDESLLSQLLFTLSEILDISQSIPEDFYIWLADIIIDNHAPLTRLIQKSDNSTDVNEERTTAGKRGLQKSILVFLNVFAKRLSKSNHSWKFSNGIGYIGGEIVHSLVQSLNLADAVHFYDLPSLECTLQCLLHVTARSGWSNGSRDLENLPLCHKFLSSLLEIVSAFHVGRGGTAMSYMGKGVTRCATLCLLHLAYEMSQHSTDKTWTSHWLYIRQGNQDEVMNTGLLWLLALWYYRDPEVRTTGLGIATALASTESGRIMLSSCCQQIPGGIWGTVLTFLLDQSECSIVRQQAAALFVNLTSQSMPDVAVSDPCIKWQGPSVQDEDTHISLVGLPALIALLHHYQFYTEMPAMISNYYADSTITPVSILDNMSTVTTSTTTATSASPSTLITTVDNDALNGSNGANITQDNRSTMYTSTPNTTHRTSTPSTSIASMQTNSSKRSSQSQVSSSSGTDASQDTASSTVLSTTEVRYPSVVTPSLIGTLCQLLRNLISLAPHDATMAVNKNNLLTNLLRLLDVDLLEGSLQQLDGKDGILLVDTLLQMYSDVLLFVKAMLQSDTPTRLSVLEDTIVWRKCLQLLSLAGRQCIKDCCLELSCHMLVSSVFSLLTSMVQLEESRALKAILPSMAKYWKTIIDCIVHVIRSSTSLSSTRVSVLKYITVLLTVEGVKQTQDKNIMFLMDGDKNSSVESDESVSSGQILCEVLLSAYDCTLPTSNSVTIQEKHLIGSALSTLLAVSHTAKTFALEAGLVESTIDQIKHIHVKLNMDSLQIGKTSSKKKQEDSQISELMNHLNLLRNFLYNSEEVKMAAYECGFSNVVHKLWSWCTVESQLMMTVLAVLCTYTARCEPACSSLAFTSLSAVSGSGPSSNSLLHSLVKYANRENSKQKKGDCSENQKSIFSLLSTLALSSECRGILWKSNFLQLFSKVPPPKKGGKGRKLNVSLMWLKLLVNLSFSAEGQQMIMKIPECLDLLLDYGQCSYQAVQMAALLILRNLCLHATSKPKLLSNDKLLPYLLDVVNGTNMHSKYIAVTALWALVYNSQKAKVSMKNGAVGPNLMEAYSNVKSMSYNPTDEQQDAMQCLNAMQTVIAMVNE